MDLANLTGRPVDGLTLAEQWALSGRWIAVELYSPQRLPLRLIEVAGTDARDCIRQLRGRGLDPSLYEYVLLTAPYAA